MTSRDEALALARELPKRITELSPLAQDAVTLARALLDCEQERAELERQRDNAYHMPLGSKAREWESRAERAEARVARLEKALSRIEEAASTGSTNDVFEALEQIRKELEFPLDGAKIHAIDCDLDEDCSCS